MEGLVVVIIFWVCKKESVLLFMVCIQLSGKIRFWKILNYDMVHDNKS